MRSISSPGLAIPLKLQYTDYQDYTMKDEDMDTHVNIGQVKRDISDLVNRVAYGGERILLTSRGKPKAALVSLADYERLQQVQKESRQLHLQTWIAQANALSQEILKRRGGAPLDVDALLKIDREDLEARSGEFTGRD
jgi:prevent-host-death family protein